MAKNARKVLSGRVHHRADTYVFTDVTLNDFANSSVPKTGRLKKNQINKVVSKVKHLSVTEDDRTWEEKLDDLNLTKTNKQALVKQTKKSNKNRKIRGEEEDEENEENLSNDTSLNENVTYYRRYPCEIWFWISDFISPEDVGRFAGICRDSLDVVLTARFWFRLYKRYYRKVADLPEKLQPHCMVRSYGLRTYVVRALHFMYPPFVSKFKSQVTFHGDPYVLTKRVCILSWSQKKKNQWQFYFKLKQTERLIYGRQDCEIDEKPGLLEMLEDITANPDDNCKVLEVTSSNFTPLPMIYGQVLKGVSLTLTADLQNYRLELNFGSGPSPYMSNNYVMLDCVLNIRVLDWWHPSFPHSDGLNSSLYSNESSILCDELEY